MSESLFDSNIWVAATFPTHEFHAFGWAALSTASSLEPAIFCRSTQQSFLRLATSPRILERYGAMGMTNRDALLALQTLLARPGVQEREEPTGTVALWHRLATANTASPKVWMDAYLAAFAISGGLRFVTLDRDFKQFEPLGLELLLPTP